MVIYVALIAILNLGLGYALAMYLGRRPRSNWQPRSASRSSRSITPTAGRRRVARRDDYFFARQFEDRFDLNRPSAGQRRHAHRAARSDAVVRAEDIAHQFAEAVDDGWMIFEIGRRVDEADGLHEAADRIEAAKLLPQRRQHAQAGSSSSFVALFLLHRVAEPADHRRAVGADRAVARHIGQSAADHHQLVNADRFARAAATPARVAEISLRGPCDYSLRFSVNILWIKYSLGDDLQTARRDLAKEAGRISLVARGAANLLDLQ